MKTKTKSWLAGFRAGVDAGRGKRTLRGSFRKKPAKRKPARRKASKSRRRR